MNVNEIKLGTKIQRKGSQVIWTVETTTMGDNETFISRGQLHLSCEQKGRTSRRSEWVSLENVLKNWKVVA